MHKFEYNKITFSYNPDMSGKVIIQNEYQRTMQVPADSLIEFVANHIRNQKIAALETMTAEEILNKT